MIILFEICQYVYKNIKNIKNMKFKIMSHNFKLIQLVKYELLQQWITN